MAGLVSAVQALAIILQGPLELVKLVPEPVKLTIAVQVPGQASDGSAVASSVLKCLSRGGTGFIDL